MTEKREVSQSGLELIKRNEGCELAAYLDTLASTPVWTIGYGDTKNVRQGMRITQAEAEERLLRRLREEFVPGVLAGIRGAPVTQEQFDAMASLAWNIGVGRLDNPDTPQNEGTGFKGSSVARLHAAGDYAGAAAAFALWNRAGGRVLAGLVRRRAEEAALYQSAATSPRPTGEVGTDPVEKIKAVQAIIGADQDGNFGRRSRAALASLLVAAGQPGI